MRIAIVDDEKIIAKDIEERLLHYQWDKSNTFRDKWY